MTHIRIRNDNRGHSNNSNISNGEIMTPTNRIVSGKSVLAAAAAGFVTAVAETSQAAPGYTIMRQLTNITTGTIEAAKIRSQAGNRIAFVSTRHGGSDVHVIDVK